MRWLAFIVLLGACGPDPETQARALTGGDPDHGRDAIRWYGCGSCHEIPGIGTAVSKVGPSLEGLAGRSYLAGHLQNTVPSLIRWIREPQQVLPGNVMPQMGVTEADARDIAAYLYTLQ